jgi:hypothetical protein
MAGVSCETSPAHCASLRTDSKSTSLRFPRTNLSSRTALDRTNIPAPVWRKTFDSADKRMSGGSGRTRCMADCGITAGAQRKSCLPCRRSTTMNYCGRRRFRNDALQNGSGAARNPQAVANLARCAAANARHQTKSAKRMSTGLKRPWTGLTSCNSGHGPRRGCGNPNVTASRFPCASIQPMSAELNSAKAM